MKSNKNLETFNSLILNQLNYGGKKYASTNTKEATDELIDDFGFSGLCWSLGKYIKRFSNVERERDLLKLACYSYIIWLKKGFFLKKEGLKLDMLDTTVEMKSANFPKFLERFNGYLEMWDLRGSTIDVENISDNEKLRRMYNLFKKWSSESWDKLTEESLMIVYYTNYSLWYRRYAQASSHDEDLKQEGDKKI